MKLDNITEFRAADGASMDPMRDTQLKLRRQAIAPQAEPIGTEPEVDKISEVLNLAMQETGLRFKELSPGKHVIATPKGQIIGQLRIEEIDGQMALQIIEELKPAIKHSLKAAAKKVGIQPFRM